MPPITALWNVAKRKAACLAAQPETKMILIARRGVALIFCELFLLHLPAGALDGARWPYTVIAGGVATMACGFYSAFGLKAQADRLPSLWSRVKAA